MVGYPGAEQFLRYLVLGCTCLFCDVHTVKCLHRVNPHVLYDDGGDEVLPYIPMPMPQSYDWH